MSLWQLVFDKSLADELTVLQSDPPLSRHIWFQNTTKLTYLTGWERVSSPLGAQSKATATESWTASWAGPTGRRPWTSFSTAFFLFHRFSTVSTAHLCVPKHDFSHVWKLIFSTFKKLQEEKMGGVKNLNLYKEPCLLFGGCFVTKREIYFAFFHVVYSG